MTDYITGHADIGAGRDERILAQLSGRPSDPAHHLFLIAPAAVCVITDPIIREAVNDLLDPAVLDRCRHVHHNNHPEPGDWHVDDYCGNPWPKGKRYVIVCYFPQDTPAEMGPTAVRVNGVEHVAAGPAGTFIVMRHHVEHRATANTTGKPRLMLKFLFRSVQ